MERSLSDFQVISSRNVVINAGKQRLLFDPTAIPTRWRSSSTLACISHAHSDHIAGFRSGLPKIATSETLDIYKALFGPTHNAQSIQPGIKVPLMDGGSLQIHSAGHMLGAAQFLIEKDGSSLVYTGDFNLCSSMTTRAAKPIPCDVLVMEATYGRPDAIFPPREQVYTEIAEWTSNELTAGNIPAFQVYATGKAQEVIRIINTYLTVPVVVDPIIAKVSEVYHQYGIPLNFVNEKTDEGAEIIRQGGFVYLSSRSIYSPRTLAGHPYSRAAVTGWAKLFPMKKVDKAFILSAHADFQQLIQYVESAQPRAVYLTCGDIITFGAVLDKLNVKHIIPKRRSQLELSDFL